ncbi:protein phosphatase 2C domain-containing protein [Salininema proteolyticum]|uniref:Protein phosphatase 2C domain-containing protein n=1 Tax=Salininema proteolyticum TaxID=1607685 RepID=A0ABV8TW98_9ACTN
MGTAHRGAVDGASEPGDPHRPNEDLARTGRHWALVLDGITRYPDDGCEHDVPWYVRTLAESVAAVLDSADIPGSTSTHPLPEILAEAVRRTTGAHSATCDVDNPLTPGATVALARWTADAVDYLVLGDAAIAWEREGAVSGVSDDRLAALPDPPAPVDVGGLVRYAPDYVASVRNQPGGFWVADSRPEAAARAVTGTLPREGLSTLLLCTDGITRLIDKYGSTWADCLRIVESGPEALVKEVRRRENAGPAPSGKLHDDATAVRVRFDAMEPDDR